MAKSFDWSKYEEKPSKSSFEWSKYEDKKEPDEKEMSKLEKSLRDIPIGLSKLNEEIGNAPSNLGKLLGLNIPKFREPGSVDYGKMYGVPEEKTDVWDKIIQSVPEFAAILAAPETRFGSLPESLSKIPKIGEYLKGALQSRPLQQATTQGLIAAGEAPEGQAKSGLTAGALTLPFASLAQSSSPLSKILSKSLMAAGGGGLGYGSAKYAGAPEWVAIPAGIGGALGGYKTGSLNAAQKARQDVLKGVEGTEYKEALNAADRLGLSYLTPAEASGNPFVGGTQGVLGKTEKGSELLYKKGEERVASEKKSIQNFMKTVFNPEEHNVLREKLYESAKEKSAPKDIFGLKNNEIFKSAEKKMLSDAAYKEELKKVPKNSVEYLDLVKREMDDMIRKAGIGTNEARLIGKTKGKLVSGLDEFAPSYKEARSIAERGIVRKNLEDYFKKKERSMTGSNFGKFLLNEKNYEKLQHNLRNVPEAQDQLKDMKLIFNRLINIPTAKTSEALARSSMSKDRASSQFAMRELKEILSAGKYDKTAVELMTNPLWKKELEKLKKVTNTDKFIGDAANLFGKVGAHESSQ